MGPKLLIPMRGTTVGSGNMSYMSQLNEDTEVVDSYSDMERATTKASHVHGSPGDGAMTPEPPEASPEISALRTQSRAESIASSIKISPIMAAMIPWIDSLDSKKEIQKFLARFISQFLQNTSRKAHQASVDVDSLMSFVEEDADFLWNRLNERLNYGFFVRFDLIRYPFESVCDLTFFRNMFPEYIRNFDLSMNVTSETANILRSCCRHCIFIKRHWIQLLSHRTAIR